MLIKFAFDYDFAILKKNPANINFFLKFLKEYCIQNFLFALS
jgi:hypothetical protein